MRIFYVTHSFMPGFMFGTERFTLNLAHAMQQAGHRVQLVAHSSFPHDAFRGNNGILVRRYSYEGIPCTTFRYRKPNMKMEWELGTNRFLRPFAERLLRQGEYHLLHVTHPMYAGPFIAAALEQGIPYVVTLSDYFTLCYRTELLNLKGELCQGPQGGDTCLRTCRIPGITRGFLSQRFSMGRRIFSHARAVVAPSEFLKERIQSEYPDLEITVIPFGSIHRRTESHDRRYSNKSRLTFGYMGSIQPKKGVHLLVQAFRKLRDANIRLRIYGNAYHGGKEYVEELVSLAYRDPRISFCRGYSSSEELAEILREIDVLCFPSSWFETFGIVVEEALSAGIPVIVSRIGAAAERIHDGVNGFTFRPGDAEDLNRTLQKIVRNRTLLNRLRENITRYASADEEAAQYEKIYRRIVRNGHHVYSD